MIETLQGFSDLGAKLDTVSLDGEKLYLKGSVPSEVVANRVWDVIKQVDPQYSDLHHEILTTGGPNQSYSVKSETISPRSATASTARPITTPTLPRQATSPIPTKFRWASKSPYLSSTKNPSTSMAHSSPLWVRWAMPLLVLSLVLYQGTTFGLPFSIAGKLGFQSRPNYLIDHGAADPVLGLWWPKAPSSTGRTSIAEVLRLRAINSLIRDRSAKRFAQDDAFVEGLEKHLVGFEKHGKIEKVTSSQDDAFLEGIEKHLVGSKNTGRSKKSQALRMTVFWRG